MRRVVAAGIASMVLMGVGTSSGAGERPSRGPLRAMVQFEGGVPVGVMDRFARVGITHAVVFRYADAAAVLAPRRGALEMVANWDDVLRVYSDPRLELHSWQAKKDTRVERVLAGTRPLKSPYTGKGVTIAVVDSGIDDNHPDLAGKVAKHVSVASSVIFDPTTGEALHRDGVDVPVGSDWYDHGTNIAGLAAGNSSAALGADMRGSAPGATLVDVAISGAGLPPSLSNENEGFFESEIAVAFEWVLEHKDDAAFPGGIRVVVSGTGVRAALPVLRDVLQDVTAAGISVVFPVGNVDQFDGYNHVLYPARYPEVISVGGVCKSEDDWSGSCGPDASWRGSNVGPELDVVAPAVDVWVPQSATSYRWNSFHPLYTGPVPGQGSEADEVNNRVWYRWEISTSMATGQVAGIVALMLDANPALEPAQIQNILKSTAHDFGPEGVDDRFGAGLVDALRAIKRAESLNPR